jgi:serine/threonine-protein kinase PknK
MGSNPRASAPDIPGVEITGVIGAGGSGVVYLGHQQGFGRDVAVKVAARSAAPEEAVRRWEREVAAIGRLSNHPNIVPVFDAGITDDGSPYLVMPFVPGGTLSDRIREEGPLPADQVAVVGAKLAGALAAVHAAGILHRDVKPDNVLWSPHGEPQLSDFGIARLQDLTTTMSGDLQATVAYAAPEVLNGSPATEAADLYGLGATLHACLTGTAPYPTGDGESIAALVARVLERPPASLVDAGVPAALAAVVDEAMHRDPARRHGSAAELRDALDQVRHAPAPSPDQPATSAPTTVFTPPVTAPQPVAAGPPPARPPSAPPPAAPPSRPRPAASGAGDDGGPGRHGRLLWAMVAAVLLLFVGLLAYGLSRDDDDGDATATGDSTTSTTAPADDAGTTEPPDPETTSTTTATSTTTTSPSTTEQPPRDVPATAAMLQESRTYFELLARGRLDEAWARTTSRFQNSQDRGAWESFWGGFDRIRVVGSSTADPETGIVVVPLDLDGSREDYQLEMRRQGGEWLVSGPVGNPTGGSDDEDD